MNIDRLPGRTILIDGRELLYFSGTSYLGMGGQPLFKEALLEGINRYGTVFSVSRYNNLQLDIYERAETYLAEWTGAEAAVTVSSGMLAGQLAAKYLSGRDFIYAPGAHPAIWNEAPSKTPVSYADFNEWAADLPNRIKPDASVVVAFNAVDPLYCEPAHFDWITTISDHAELVLLADDSHGIGVRGEDGSGVLKILKEKFGVKPNIKIIVIASLAKAMGVPGGVILSEALTIHEIKKSPFFGGATPVVPAYLYALLESKILYETSRRDLQENVRLFVEGVDKNAGFKYLPGFPVFYTKNKELYKGLLQNGVFISHFPYPTPSSEPISRIVISALHTPKDIAKLLEALKISY